MNKFLSPKAIFDLPLRMTAGVVFTLLLLNPIAVGIVYGAVCCEACQESGWPEDDSSEPTENSVLRNLAKRAHRPGRLASFLESYPIYVGPLVHPLCELREGAADHRKPLGHRWTHDLRAPLLN